MNLVQHIEEKNAATRAWVAESPADRWAGYLTTDLCHWSEYGIYTPEQLDRYLAIEGYVNAYKDIHGIRPNWIDFDSMPTALIEEDLCRLLDAEYNRVAEESAEDTARIAALCAELSIDLVTYDRWMKEAVA